MGDAGNTRAAGARRGDGCRGAEQPSRARGVALRRVLPVETQYYANDANLANPPVRVYPVFTKDPSLNFPQAEDYALRILKRRRSRTDMP
jgi:hypothetical protein